MKGVRLLHYGQARQEAHLPPAGEPWAQHVEALAAGEPAKVVPLRPVVSV
jgi:hypothetical protein